MKPALVLGGLFLATAAVLSAFADDKPGGAAVAAGAEAPAGKDVQAFVLLTEKRPVLVRLHVFIDGKPYQAVWEEFVESVFKSLDRAGNGVLSAAEAERTPPAAVLFGSAVYANAGYPAMADLDADKDGKVTLDELKAYYRRAGVAPFQFQVQMGPPPTPPGLAGLYQAARPPAGEAVTDALFALLDTDKDGKLSKEELAAAPSVLLKLDLNDNELITVRDIMATSDRPAPVAPVRPFGGPFGPPAPKPATGPSPVVLVGAGASADNLAKQLLARYAKPGGAEAKKLSRADLGLDEATFKHLDADSDGALDADELARFARRDPDVELTIRLGQVRPVDAPVEIVTSTDRRSPLADSLRPLQGAATLDLGATRLDVVMGGGYDAPTLGPQQLRQFYKGQFAGADKGNKGHLDQKDCDDAPLFRGLFKVMDRDGDGKVTANEMLAFLVEAQRYQATARASCVLLTYGDQGNGLFDLLDTNRDGRLSVREMRQAVKLLETLDHDGDGRLSRSEVPRCFRLALGQGGVGNAQLPPRLAMMARQFRPTPPVPRPTAGPVWFRKMDRNGDGDVSRREFPGTDEEFAVIDTDGDGLISLEEAERYDAKVRKP